MKKKLLALFVAVAMLVSIIPATAFAETDANETVEPVAEAAPNADATDAYFGSEQTVAVDEWIWEDDFRMYEINLDHYAMLNFSMFSEYEYSGAKFEISVLNLDTGEVAYTKEEYAYSDGYFDSISLDPGNYSVYVGNNTYTIRKLLFDITYNYMFYADDPYYAISETALTVYTKKTAKLDAVALPEGSPLGTVEWSCDNPAVATVDQSGNVTGVTAGNATVTAVINGVPYTCAVTVKNPEYTSLNLTAVTLYAGEKETLKIGVIPEDYGITGLTWTSSDKTIATVDSKGVVTAKKAGTATITAKIDGVTRTCKVTVKPMAMSSKTATVYVKKTTTLKVNGGSGTTTWKSSNKNVATVTSKGVVKGIKPGTATITGKKNGKSFTCKVTVKWEPETGIVSKKTIDLPNGGRDSYKVKVNGSATIKVTAKNNSGNDSLYLVLEDEDLNNIWGEFIYEGESLTKTKTVKAGTYYVYYSTENDCDITVQTTVKPQLSKTSTAVGKGYTTTLYARGVKNGGKWTSSNSKIATVTSKGVVKGKKTGTCYIKYTTKTGKVLKCKVTVKPPVTCTVTCVSDVAIYNDCYVKFNNYTNKKITYIKFNIKQYDNRGSRLSSPYGYYFVNDDIKAKSEGEWYFWVNNYAKKCKATITKVYFADGSTWRP